MNRTAALFTLCLLTVLPACTTTTPIVRQDVVTFKREGTHEARFDRSATQWIDMSMDYLLYLPPGYDSSVNVGKKWPLLFMLHGIGENGTAPRVLMKYGPARFVEEGKDFPFIIVTPQHRGGSGMADKVWNVELTTAMMYDVIERYRVDKDRVYLTGVSSGGLGTWVIAANQPNLFAAIAPVSSWGFLSDVRRIAHVPVWAFHGGADMIVTLDSIKPMIEVHRAAGGQSKLTVYPGVGHEAWENAYADERLYDWFLQHKRK